ncbi:hypothetical protein EW026_g2526 [Hermanssonia centrifuga]|uniref:START domain-containing protein n=1 Tax=Hermanssonia centrifuga TaxID=98765 RepID=A0A4S4KN37_9APHY|nr:hypothetical protein EW026_g2526 [Hermanssonia centrifuga]
MAQQPRNLHAPGTTPVSVKDELVDVVLHRKIVKGASVYRAVLDVSTTDEPQITLDACRAVLATPELRKEWDPAVERSQLLEMFDQVTRIYKTNFTLGWPASPRDAVTISRTFSDATTVIDISTSLPRSPDEPAYLRPSPPYVRSEVGLFAWCIQLVTSSSGAPRLRMTCFWQHDLRALWTGGFGSAPGVAQQLAAMTIGFFKTVKTRGSSRIPLLSGYGNGVSVERVRFQIDREALTADYAIVPEEEEHERQEREQSLEELHAIREHRRLTRSVEWLLPVGEGWDVQITTRASSEAVTQLPWTAHATRSGQDRIVLKIKHSELPNDHSVLKPVETVEERDPSSYYMSQPILQDTTSMADEPEAKWKRTTESRGVSVAQLDSIDPTLVVYRAEATFVGLGLWDLYAAIATPGARAFWDRAYDDAVLLEDVNQLTELWHHKTKPTWPVNGRDAVVLKTVYKSPTTIHIFAFSADEPNLFPNVPSADPNVIRTQIDLQGWAIEALSPTTTLVTLLEQSDPKGWSNKASIPQQMVSYVAGVGDFVIKCGGPPVQTRLEGAKSNDIRYDHEKGSFRIEYERCASRRSSSSEGADEPSFPNTPVIECELRCDLDNWASSLDIVIDPPPQSITCLRRHRLSLGGGGLWLTISHDAVHAGDERLQAIVRRAPQGVAKEKGLVMVNGARVDVDVEELADKEVKHLAKQKRVKPARIPLDQPPVLGVIRRRKAEWDSAEQDGNATDSTTTTTSPTSASSSQYTSSAPAFASSFTRYLNYAVEQATVTTQQAVAAISPAAAAGADAMPSSSKPPMQYALEALSYLQVQHARPVSDGWTLVSDKGFPVYRKIEAQISSVIPVHKGEKVVEGFSADEMASVLTSYECRKQWDTRFDSVHVFESFGAGSHTNFTVTKGGFPFRDRGFYLANLMARTALARRTTGETDQTSDGRTAVFLVSASFSAESISSFAPSKYNPYTLPVGRVFVDGWILETLDPYGSENYTIPSTRCTRITAVDYAGSIPAAVNSSINAMLPKSILALETYLKGLSPPPFTRLPASGLMILSKTDENPDAKSWTLRKRDSTHEVVNTRFSPGDRVYKRETRSAPPKPQWLLDLEVGRAVIFVEVRPASLESNDKKTTVTIDGNSTPVFNEKESLTNLGRDELLDGRTSKMDVLVRTSSEEEQLPQELLSPIAIADHLLDDVAPTTAISVPLDTTEGESLDTPQAESPIADEKLPDESASQSDGVPPDSSTHGLLRFLNSYPNPLTRFATPAGRPRPILRSLSGSTTSSRQASGTARDNNEASTSSGHPVALLSPRADNAPTYPLSTVIIVALIAFLIGSLLRSMLSPADFVYVVSDLKDAEDVSSGWREIKRLLECPIPYTH